MQQIQMALVNAWTWLTANWAGLGVLLTQWIAIVLSVQRRHDADFVVWLWGVVATVAAALFASNSKFNTLFWKVFLTLFGAAVAVAGYFLLP
jgi:uncharacterized membrane protein YhaH (DUF805 family)